MTADTIYPVSADATSDPPHPVSQQIRSHDHPDEAEQHEQVKCHLIPSFAVRPSTKCQRDARVALHAASRLYDLDTQRCSSLVGERDRRKELLLRHPSPGISDQHETSEQAVLV